MKYNLPIIKEFGLYTDIFYNPKSTTKVQRAGFIPYKFINDELYLFLGENIKNNLFTDFGGGCIRENKIVTEDPIECAIRETYEETQDIININQNNVNYITHIAVTPILNWKDAVQLIMFINMDNLDNNIDNIYQEKILNPKYKIELKSIKLIKAEELLKKNSKMLDYSLKMTRRYFNLIFKSIKEDHIKYNRL